jgi:nicotinate phosphoribosyltransferase
MRDAGPHSGYSHALFCDLYELTMGQSYFLERMHEPATFSLFARTLPDNWGYFVAAGLDSVLTDLESVAFNAHDLAYLERSGRFTTDFIAYLADFRFTGSVRAMPEGTVFFPQEPVLEVTAPVIEAQLVETFVLNQVHFQSLIASKAIRCVEAVNGRHLMDFSARRTHGSDAALKVARSSYLAGFESTSNVLAAAEYGIAPAGTMAHSYIESFPDELSAFRAYARAFPDACVLLLDTYDTVAGVRNAVIVARELAAEGHRLRGVRLDSGDMDALSRAVRRILDDAGFQDVSIIASGGLDEHEVHDFLAAGAPIDIFGVGTRMGVAADAPYLDMAYKLVEYAGTPRLKLSSGKATWPGPKQVWRRSEGGHFVEDILCLAEEPAPAGASPLLEPVMSNGKATRPGSLEEARERARSDRLSLPEGVRKLIAPNAYPVRISAALQDLRDTVGRHMTATIAPEQP